MKHLKSLSRIYFQMIYYVYFLDSWWNGLHEGTEFTIRGISCNFESLTLTEY